MSYAFASRRQLLKCMLLMMLGIILFWTLFWTLFWIQTLFGIPTLFTLGQFKSRSIGIYHLTFRAICSNNSAKALLELAANPNPIPVELPTGSLEWH